MKRDVTQDAQPASVVQYADFLKQRYLEEPILQDDPWPPSIGQHYINLALIKHEKRAHTQQSFQEDLLRGKIDQIQQEKETITPDSMFTDDKGKTLPSFKMLLDGAPGVGKTTLCRKICQDWAKGEILQDFMLVYVPLRDSRLAKAQRIEHLFYHDDPVVQDSITRHVRKTQGAGTVFIFDGFDELSKKERERESLFLDIFKGKLFHKCSALVSSRPYASDRLQRMSAVTRHIEVLGFNEEQIIACIGTAISNPREASGLIQQLESRGELLSLCYIPLNCAILIYVYTKERYTLPRTISELFSLFIRNTLQRQSDIHGFDKETFKRHINTLSELAFNTLAEDKLTFGSEEVPSLEVTLGLMTATKSFSSSGMAITYQFIHLTIHEYLAAKWIASQFTEQQQAAFLHKHLLDDRFRMALIFLAGITKLEGRMLLKVLSTQNLQMYQTDPDKLPNKAHLKKFNLLIHLAYESHNPESCSAVAKSVDGRVLQHKAVGGSLRNEFEVNTMGYFIAQSGCTWEIIDLDIQHFQEIFSQHMQTASVSTVIKRFVVDFKHEINYQLSQFKTVWTFFLSTPFKRLEYLDVQHSTFANRNEPRLSTEQFLSTQCLKQIYLIFSQTIYIQRTITNYIISIVRYCKTLEYLELTTGGGNSNINGFNLANLLNKIQQSSIKHLRVCVNVFPDPSLYTSLYTGKEQRQRANKNVSAFYNSVQQLLSNKTDLHSLSLSSSHILETDEKDYYRYTEHRYNYFMPKCNTILKSLNRSQLKHLSITSLLLVSQTPRQLATMLSMNNMLQSLIISIDRTSHMFVIYNLILGLKHNTTLRKLVVDYTNTSTKDTSFINLLFQTLKTQSCLEVVVIKPNRHLRQASIWGCIPTLLLHNSVLSVLKITAQFTECQLKTVARCLVLNGRRRSIELEFSENEHKQARNDNIIQSEVNEFKGTLFIAMTELLAHLLATRQQRQENFLQVHTRVKTTEFMYSWETFEKRYKIVDIDSYFQQLPCKSMRLQHSIKY